MAGGDELRIYVEKLAEALQHNMPPPPIPADMPAGAVSEIDMLLAGLGMAGNSGDPKDTAAGQAGFEQRGQKTGDAMAKFPAGDQDASKQLEQMMSSATQMPQQLMQSFSGLFQGLSQPLNQAMQQGMQMATQMASSMGKAGQGAGLGAELPAEAFGDALGAGGAALGAGGGAGAELAGATTPAGNLGPPPTPSAPTYPTSAATPAAPVPSPPDSGAGTRGAMGGMPMMPPGAMGGAGAGGSEGKAETKRVVPPSVTNGAPVQGRITAPQTAPEVVKRVAGKPIASRRILSPDDQRGKDDDEIDRNRS
jgi:hypothetical protein